MFERTLLSKIFRPTKEVNGIWRIKKKNKELDELIKHRNIIKYVKAQGLNWFGHINRMPETSIVKSIQGVTGGTDQTSGECSLGQTIPI